MGAASTQAGGTGTVIIDTLAAARELEAAGIEPKHAEAIVSIQRRSSGDLATKTNLANAVSKLATKIELRKFKSELEVKIERVRGDPDVKIERVGGAVQKARAGLSRWMLAGRVAQTRVLATLCWFVFSSLPGV